MNARFQKVRGNSNLMRDKHTGAILNMDKSGIEQARKAKSLKLKQEQRIEKLEQEIRSSFELNPAMMIG